jgi:hypothetical protein
MRVRIIYKDLDRTSEREEQLGRPVCRWEYTIKTDFIGIIWERLDWVCLAQDSEPCVNILMNLTYHEKTDKIFVLLFLLL